MRATDNLSVARIVPEYRIVDGDAQVVERWRPSDDRPEILSGTLEWSPEAGAAAFVIDLPGLFARASGS